MKRGCSAPFRFCGVWFDSRGEGGGQPKAAARGFHALWQFGITSLSQVGSMKLEIYVAFITVAFSFQADADTDACVKDLYMYGQTFSPAEFGKRITTKKSSEPNKNGVPGEQLRWTTTSLRDNWIKILGCNSCSPRKSTTELFLTTATAKNLPCGLTDGMSENDISLRLGAPHEKQGEYSIYYYPPLEQNQIMSLRMDKGKLNAIHWLFYVD